ncbi:MAG TPA: hypothetical protein VKY85_15575 [Candidatus Angelobacter sp.]|nr:hypothetical protein [Candidatus Angelobacter sp.]
MKQLTISLAMIFSLTAFAQLPGNTNASAPGASAVAGSNEKVPAVTVMLHGWVVDEVCGRVTGRTSEHASCARMCSRIMHKTMVFVSDYNGVNIAVKNPKELRPYMGKHLDIEARIIAAKTIEVLHVDPASANAPPNDPIAAHDVLILPQAEPAKPASAKTAGTQAERKLQ